MKTAVSIPDEVFRSADALADRLGISRSRLYADALTQYLAMFSARKVTEKLDAVYATESSRLDPPVKRSQKRTAKRIAW